MFSRLTASSSETKTFIKKSSSGRPRLFGPEEYGVGKHNSARTGLRKLSKISSNVLVSLQRCALKDNNSCLEKAIERTKNELQIQRIKGLKAILDVLLTNVESSCLQSFMQFHEVYELFLGFQLGTCVEKSTTSDRKRFKELLCHPEHGLCVYIVEFPEQGKIFLVLRPDDVDLEQFLQAVVDALQRPLKTERLSLDHTIVRTLLNSMDSEWNRRVARVLIGANRSSSQLSELGIDYKSMSKLIKQVTTTAQDVENAQLAAEDLLVSHYNDMLKRVEVNLKAKEDRQFVKEKEWSASQLNDLKVRLY